MGPSTGGTTGTTSEMASSVTTDSTTDNGDGGTGSTGATGTATSGSTDTDSGTTGGMVDCSDPTVLCVDDDLGPTQEYDTIQAAVDDAGPGDTVVVHPGSYAGFRIDHSGTAQAPIVIRAVDGVDLIDAEPGPTNNVIRIEAASYITIEGFRIVRDGSPMPYDYDNSCVAARGATVDAPMLGLVVARNEVAGCSPGGLYFSQTAGLQLLDNWIHDNVQPTSGGEGHGVYLSNAATDDVVVRGNVFEDNDGPGIHMNGDASVGGDGIQTGHRFEANIVVGNGMNGFNMDGVRDAFFVNNVFADNGRHGMRGYRIDAAAGPAGFVLINNTFVGNDASAAKLSEDDGGHVLFNNLVVANTENGFDIAESTPMAAANLVLDGTAGVFVDAAVRDYRLAMGSPAIDQGVPSFAGHEAPPIDANEFPRVPAPPDAGAYELGSR